MDHTIEERLTELEQMVVHHVNRCNNPHSTTAHLVGAVSITQYRWHLGDQVDRTKEELKILRGIRNILAFAALANVIAAAYAPEPTQSTLAMGALTLAFVWALTAGLGRMQSRRLRLLRHHYDDISK